MSPWPEDWHTEGRRDYTMDPDRHTPIDPEGTPLTTEQLEALGWRVTTIPQADIDADVEAERAGINSPFYQRAERGEEA